MRWGAPNRVNYYTRFPVAKGVRDCFSENVVGAIHIGIDELTVCGAEQPALDAPADILFVMPNRLIIEEAALTGMALVHQNDRDAY